MGALTRDEAIARAAAIDVHHYDVVLDLPADGPDFGAITTIRFTAHAPDTFVDCAASELLAATLDGRALDVGTFAAARLPLTGLGGDHVLVVESRMGYSRDGEGLHRYCDPADDAVYLCATSGVDNAPRWIACFDQPDLKATYALDVTCPPEWTVLGNGAATSVSPGHWRLATTAPISTYLVTLVAGRYHSVRGEHAGIPLGLHVRASLAAELERDAPELLHLTSIALDAFHDLFEIPYPFGEYHQAFVPEFNWGAMENPGCVTFRDQMIFRSKPSAGELLARVTTVVHEMAHMWFGDLVTMTWWDDLWLNESFAEYLAHRVTTAITDLPAWEDFAAARKSWGYDADRLASTHPVAGNGATSAAAALEDFDGISYAKGASVLRQLADYLGDEMFLGGLRQHIRQHAYGNATFADLVGAWADHAAPGTPDADALSRWAAAWLRTEGVDVVSVAVSNDGWELERGAPVYGPPADRAHAMTVAVLPDGPHPTTVRLDADRLTVPAAPCADDQVVVPNAGDQTWATVRLDPSHWARLPDVMGRIAEPVTRVALWNALRTAVADGVVAPALAVDVVTHAIAGELDVVTPRVLAWITAVVPLYLAPGPARADAYTRLTACTAELLAAGAPGSGAQLTSARAWVALTDDVAALRRWTAGEPGAPGLAVDEELRWAVLERRAALGDLSPTELDDAYAADRTGSGSVHAARCRALRPDPAAKAEAWGAVIDPAGGRSQYELGALAGGLWVAGQEDLTASYADRWFDEVPATVAFRSGWSLTGIAGACFPRLAVTAATLARAEEFAADTALEPSLRRIASDGADGLRRALAVRS